MNLFKSNAYCHFFQNNIDFILNAKSVLSCSRCKIHHYVAAPFELEDLPSLALAVKIKEKKFIEGKSTLILRLSWSRGLISYS
jgi:hypothetical protein